MSGSAPQTRVNPWLIAVSVMLATFMEVLDTTIANVALAHIAGSLAISSDESTWILTSYLISNAIIIPSTAWFGQKFGRKRFLIICVGIFTMASLFCGLATNLPMLLLMRVIQGAGGGALQPIAQSILLESFPKEKHGQAMGVYGLGVVTAPILGPVLGGWITDNYSWRWIFFINVPIGLLAMILMYRFIDDPHWMRNAKTAPLDFIGFGFMSLWLGCQEIVLDKGQEDDWFGSSFITTRAVLATIGLFAFLVRVLTAQRPFVDLRLLKNYNFALSLFLMFFTGLSLYSQTAVIPLFLQSLLGYTSWLSGLAMIPRGLGALIAMPLVGRLVGKVKGSYLVAIGFLIFSGSACWIATFFTLDISPAVMFWPFFFSGVAISFVFVPLNTMAFGTLKPEQIGNASGIFNLMRNVGGSVGISFVTTLAARRAQFHQAVLAGNLSPYDTSYLTKMETLTTTFAGKTDAVTAQQQATVSLYNTLVTQSSLLAYLDYFALFMFICIACVFVALSLKKVKPGSRPIAMH
jgi:MFS transporter, DHA2 family, multidrug resistance protein